MAGQITGEENCQTDESRDDDARDMLVFGPDECQPVHRDEASTETVQGRAYRNKIKNAHCTRGLQGQESLKVGWSPYRIKAPKETRRQVGLDRN